ncbi:MAG: ATP-dependent Clp protease proteolytic subunit [Patescibacteria group bacterium]
MTPEKHVLTEAREKVETQIAQQEINECLKISRVIKITGKICCETQNNYSFWNRQLKYLLKESKPFVIVVNSPGGDALEVLRFEKAIETVKEKGIRVYSLGAEECRSAAVHALLLEHPEGIYVTPGTEIQLHGSTGHLTRDPFIIGINSGFAVCLRLSKTVTSLYSEFFNKWGSKLVSIKYIPPTNNSLYQYPRLLTSWLIGRYISRTDLSELSFGFTRK